MAMLILANFYFEGDFSQFQLSLCSQVGKLQACAEDQSNRKEVAPTTNYLCKLSLQIISPGTFNWFENTYVSLSARGC